VHPTQLYELAAALVFGALAVWSMRKRHPEGVRFLGFALGFTLFRLGNNLLRVQLPTFILPGWFYPAFFLAICAVLTGLLIWRLRMVEQLAGPIPRPLNPPGLRHNFLISCPLRRKHL
jgi:prolipoprotein diacylglyceryltransferase